MIGSISLIKDSRKRFIGLLKKKKNLLPVGGMRVGMSCKIWIRIASFCNICFFPPTLFLLDKNFFSLPSHQFLVSSFKVTNLTFSTGISFLSFPCGHPTYIAMHFANQPIATTIHWKRSQDTHIHREDRAVRGGENGRLGASFCVSGALHSLDTGFADPNTR